MVFSTKILSILILQYIFVAHASSFGDDDKGFRKDSDSRRLSMSHSDEEEEKMESIDSRRNTPGRFSDRENDSGDSNRSDVTSIMMSVEGEEENPSLRRSRYGGMGGMMSEGRREDSIPRMTESIHEDEFGGMGGMMSEDKPDLRATVVPRVSSERYQGLSRSQMEESEHDLETADMRERMDLKRRELSKSPMGESAHVAMSGMSQMGEDDLERKFESMSGMSRRKLSDSQMRNSELEEEIQHLRSALSNLEEKLFLEKKHNEEMAQKMRQEFENEKRTMLQSLKPVQRTDMKKTKVKTSELDGADYINLDFFTQNDISQMSLLRILEELRIVNHFIPDVSAVPEEAQRDFSRQIDMIYEHLDKKHLGSLTVAAIKSFLRKGVNHFVEISPLVSIYGILEKETYAVMEDVQLGILEGQVQFYNICIDNSLRTNEEIMSRFGRIRSKREFLSFHNVLGLPGSMQEHYSRALDTVSDMRNISRANAEKLDAVYSVVEKGGFEFSENVMNLNRACDELKSPTDESNLRLKCRTEICYSDDSDDSDGAGARVKLPSRKGSNASKESES